MPKDAFNVGDEIHHAGEDGRFIVKKILANGDLSCFGGSGWTPGAVGGKYHAAFRTFKSQSCRPAKSKRKLRVSDDDSA